MSSSEGPSKIPSPNPPKRSAEPLVGMDAVLALDEVADLRDPLSFFEPEGVVSLLVVVVDDEAERCACASFGVRLKAWSTMSVSEEELFVRDMALHRRMTTSMVPRLFKKSELACVAWAA